MLSSLILFFILEKRDQFNSLNIIIFRVFSLLFNILFLYFAAQAYKPDQAYFELNQRTVFEYIVIGEFTLRLVCDALVLFQQHTRVIVSNGVFETLLGTRTHFFYILLKRSLSSLVYSILFIFVEIILLSLIFDFSFTLKELFFACLLNLFALPLFMAIGIVGCSFFIHLKRGSSLIGIITTLLTASSGAYFPISVFPKFIIQILKLLNPFEFLVRKTRIILNPTEMLPFTTYLLDLISILTIGFILLFLSKKCLSFVISDYRKKGYKLRFLR